MEENINISKKNNNDTILEEIISLFETRTNSNILENDEDDQNFNENELE